MRRIADGTEYITPSTIDDPATLVEVKDAMQISGYAQKKAGADH
jgi:hypothetical protein